MDRRAVSRKQMTANKVVFHYWYLHHVKKEKESEFPEVALSDGKLSFLTWLNSYITDLRCHVNTHEIEIVCEKITLSRNQKQEYCHACLHDLYYKLLIKCSEDRPVHDLLEDSIISIINACFDLNI